MSAVAGPGGHGARGDRGQPTEIKVRLPEPLMSGVFANSMLVQHSAEEFIMDFAMVVGTTGTVVARVVTSPGHVKRIVAALQDNLKKYEAAHGPIRGASVHPPLKVGFQPPDGEDE